jgi:hypothetical protein
MIPCKFSFPPKGHWFLLVCLNLVHKKGMTPDEAMMQIDRIGVEPTLMYQWNEKYREIDVLAVIYDRPLNHPRNLTEAQEDRIWEIFGNECILSMGNGTGREYPHFNARNEIEKQVPPPPQKPAESSKFLTDLSHLLIG